MKSDMGKGLSLAIMSIRMLPEIEMWSVRLGSCLRVWWFGRRRRGDDVRASLCTLRTLRALDPRPIDGRSRECWCVPRPKHEGIAAKECTGNKGIATPRKMDQLEKSNHTQFSACTRSGPSLVFTPSHITVARTTQESSSTTRERWRDLPSRPVLRGFMWVCPCAECVPNIHRFIIIIIIFPIRWAFCCMCPFLRHTMSIIH